MIVIVDEAVFERPRGGHLELVAIFALCFEGRHALLTDPPYSPGESPVMERWLSSLPTPLREEVTLVLDQGPEAASQRPASAPPYNRPCPVKLSVTSSR